MTQQMKNAYSLLKNSQHRFADTLSLWRDRSAGRRRVVSLDDRMLADIGFSRADAERVARTPFWRP